MAADHQKPTSEDEQLGRQLNDFFATVSGRRTEMPPRTPPLGKTPATPKIIPDPPPPVVDVAGNVIRQLNAQVEVIRSEARDGTAAVLRSLASIDGRLTQLEAASPAGADQVRDLRLELFEWLQEFGVWQVEEFRYVNSMLEAICTVLKIELAGVDPVDAVDAVDAQEPAPAVTPSD